MKKRAIVDRPLLIITIILCIVGGILVFSASWPTAVLKFENGYYFILLHLRSLALGFFCLFVGMNIPYKKYKKYAIPLMIIGIILNLMLFTSYGSDSLGSTRWLKIRYLPRFMPSDVLKITSIIFMASICSSLGKNIRKFRNFILIVIFVGVSVGVVLIRDMGSAMVIAIALGSIILAAGIKFRYVLILLMFGSAGLYYTMTPYRLERIAGFLDPFGEGNDSYQLMNSLYALAMGGITGVGLGKGVQKFSYIPHVYNDFIFAVIGEEFGLIGASCLVVLFFLFIWRGYLIAFNSKDRFGKYLALGFATLIGVQAFIHIMVNIGLAPVTGITLPFISFGGTSLMVTLYATGIILNISKENSRSIKWNT